MTTDVKGRTYTIEITVTEEEAEFLHKEIHKIYKATKQDGLKDREGMDALETYYRELGLLRDLRNAFATPLRTYYMGEDA